MSEEQWKGSDGRSGDPHHHHYHSDPQYGTFQDASSQKPAMGFPQPIPLPGASGYPPHHGQNFYPHGYQSVPAYADVAEGRPLREPRLPCCGIGLGWFLFIIGFFLAAIPWYVAAFIVLCATRVDHREKPGYVACTIAAIVATIAYIVGATKGADVWWGSYGGIFWRMALTILAAYASLLLMMEKRRRSCRLMLLGKGHRCDGHVQF